MRVIIVLFALSFGLPKLGTCVTTRGFISKVEIVYLCHGQESVRYHSRANCRGLNNCSTQIERTHIHHALRIGRTACQICY